MNKNREKAEMLIYKVFDELDPTKSNSSYYKNLFKNMTDEQFLKFCKKRLPFRFHTRLFEIEPNLSQANKALKIIGVPLLEKIALPYLYTDKDNKPIWSKPCMVIYIHLKKMKQFITKKNSVPTNIDNRDMKSGALLSTDKGGRTSDREMESLAVMGLNKTMKELATWRADYMDAKSQAYQTINTLGTLSDKDIDMAKEDSVSKNTLNAYMVSALLNSNILNQDYLLPITIANRQRKVVREVE